MNISVFLKAIELTYIIGITFNYFKIKKNYIKLVKEVDILITSIKGFVENLEIENDKFDLQ